MNFRNLRVQIRGLCGEISFIRKNFNDTCTTNEKNRQCPSFNHGIFSYSNYFNNDWNIHNNTKSGIAVFSKLVTIIRHSNRMEQFIRFYSWYQAKVKEGKRRRSGTNNFFIKESPEKERRKFYEDHVTALLGSVKKKQSDPFFPPTMFKAVDSLSEVEKEMIFQHMWTFEDSFMYDLHRTTKEGHKSIEYLLKRRDIVISEMLFEIEREGFARPPTRDWIQLQDFYSAIGIKHTGLLENVRNRTYSPEFIVSGSLRNKIPKQFIDSENEWRLGDPNNRFAGSKSEQKINELLKTINDYSEKINKIVERIDSIARLFPISEAGLKEYFAKLFLDPKLRPVNFAACYECLKFINDGNQDEYKKMLDKKSNDDPFAWLDSSWENTDIYDEFRF